MGAFDALGVSPLLIEALASEGIEKPTPLQSESMPAIGRGTSVVIEAAPGSGLLVAYGIPLLDRIALDTGRPAALILTPARGQARSLALSLAQLATNTGHRVAALGPSWADARGADIVFSTLPDLVDAIGSSSIKLDGVSSLVIDGASELLGDDSQEQVGQLLSAIVPEGSSKGGRELQVVVVAHQLTTSARRWIDGHLRKTVFIPAEAAGGGSRSAPVRRGTLTLYTIETDLESDLPDVVAGLVGSGTARVLLFVRSEDRAADLGDLLGLYGWSVGPPGDLDRAVWLGLDPLVARSAIDGKVENEAVAVVSVDVPSSADDLDRRHGTSGTNVVLAHPHELPHLRRVAAEAGYSIEPTLRRGQAGPDEGSRFVERLEAAMATEDLVPYLALLEPLFQKWSASEVAAALAALLRKHKVEGGTGQEILGPPGSEAGSGGRARPPAWTRLFFSIGRRDGVGAGDLLGAIAGESGIKGSQVGRIELRDSFSRVEVQDSVAEQVLESLNGTSLRGRSLRVDYDRAEARPRGRTSRRKQPGRDG